ncbi:GIY-YIG nuclease family protein [Patescibacteria group bacterium]|nr:GIY-YIG nuclease family protein [Patescibacteria group bacterium]
MNYTYIIKSINNNWFYIGSTKDLRARFLKHNAGQVRSTKNRRPYELIYYEAYKSYTLAKSREYQLKKNGQQKEIVLQRLGYKK